MKTKITFLLALFLISKFVVAQKVEIKWSPELDEKKKTFIGDIIYSDESGVIYTSSKVQRKMFSITEEIDAFVKVDPNFNEIYNKEFTKSEDKNKVLTLFLPLKNTVAFFYRTHDKKLGKNTYTIQKYDYNMNKVGSETTVQTLDEDYSKYPATTTVSSNDHNKGVRVYENAKIGGFSFFGIGGNASKKSQSTSKKIYLNVFDGDAKIIYKKIYTFPNRMESMINIEEVRISNKGEVFILTKDYLTPERKEKIKDEKSDKKVPGFKYTVWKFSVDGSDVKEYSINLDEKYINSMSMNINKETDLISIAGFYNDDENKSLQGMFNLEINGESAIKKNMKDFPNDFIEEFKKHKVNKKNDDDDGLSTRFKIDYVLPKKDGGSFITSEFFYIKTVTVTTSSGTRTTTYYYNYDILVANVDKEGKITSFTRIPKRQVEVNRMLYSSYVATEYNNKLYLLYNDNPKNEELEEDEKSVKTTGFGKSNCVMYVLDNEGNSSKKVLYSNEETETILRPLDSRIMDSNLIMLYATKKKDEKLGVLKIEE